jgi:hypothetical protein
MKSGKHIRGNGEGVGREDFFGPDLLGSDRRRRSEEIPSGSSSRWREKVGQKEWGKWRNHFSRAL